MYKYLLVLLLTFNVSYASTAKLGDYFTSNAGIIEILAKFGIKGSDAKEVQSFVASSISALGNKRANLSKAELTSVLSKLPVAGPDLVVRKDLQALLEIPADKLEKTNVVTAINNLIYLANRHGKAVLITCAECVNDSLSKEGFKFTIATVRNSAVTKLLNDVIPKNPIQLSNFIAARMKKLGMGNFANRTPQVILPEDEKSLALFLALAESGSKDQKTLIEAIKKVSTRNEKVDILDSKNPHKFWKILAEDMTAQDMAGWTKMLDEVSERAKKSNLTAEEAFYRTLKDKAQGNEYLTKQYETIKAKRCFFK